MTIGVGTLVSSQEQRAAVVPRINRGQTSCQQRVLFLATGGVGGTNGLWGELLRMEAMGGASPTRPSPPTFSPDPTPPLSAPRVSGFGFSGSW